MAKQNIKSPSAQSLADIENSKRQAQLGEYMETGSAGPRVTQSEALDSKYDYGVGVETDINEQRAQRQTFGDKFANGMVKMAGTAATSAVEPAAMLIGGTMDWIRTGDFNLVNNDATKLLDSANEHLSEAMPHYYSKEEQEGGLSDRLFTANFLTDKLTNGLGFMLGAVASGYGMNKALSGFKFADKFQKLMKGAKGLDAGDDMVRNADVVNELTRYLSSAKASNTAQNVLVGTVGSMGESSIEARHLENELMDKMAKDPKFENMPFEEKQKLAKSMGKINFWVNMAVVGYSNYSQFPSIFARGYANEAGQRLAQQASRRLMQDGEKLVVEGTNRQALRGVANMLKGAVPEAGEEYIQGVSSRALEDYALHKYDTNASNSDGAMNIIKGYVDEAVKSIGDTDAQEEAILGFVIGMLGGGKSSYQAIAQEDNALQEVANTYNQETEGFDKKLRPIIDDIVRAEQYADHRTNFLNNGDRFNYNSAEFAQFYSYVDSRIQAGRYEEVENMIQQMEDSSPDDLKEQYGIDKSETDIRKIASVLRERAQGIKDTKDIIDESFAHVQVPDGEVENLGEIKQQMAYYASMAKENDRRGKELQQLVSDQANGLSLSVPVTAMNKSMRNAAVMQREIDAGVASLSNYMDHYFEGSNISDQEKQEISEMPYHEKLKYMQDFASPEAQQRLDQLFQRIDKFNKEKAQKISSSEHYQNLKMYATAQMKDAQKRLAELDKQYENAQTEEDQKEIADASMVVNAEILQAKAEISTAEKAIGLQEATLVDNWGEILSRPQVSMDKANQSEISELQEMVRRYDTMITERKALLEKRRSQRVGESDARRLELEAQIQLGEAENLQKLLDEKASVDEILRSAAQEFDAGTDSEITKLEKAKAPYQRILNEQSKVEDYWNTVEAVGESIRNSKTLGAEADRLLKNTEELIKNREAKNDFISKYNDIFTDFKSEEGTLKGLVKWREKKKQYLQKLNEAEEEDARLSTERQINREKVIGLMDSHPNQNLPENERLFAFEGARGRRYGRIIKVGEDYFFKANSGVVAAVANNQKHTKKNLAETHGETVQVEGETFTVEKLYTYNPSNISPLSQEAYQQVEAEQEAKKQLKALSSLSSTYKENLKSLNEYHSQIRDQYQRTFDAMQKVRDIYGAFIGNNITTKTKQITHPVTGEKIRLNVQDRMLFFDKIDDVLTETRQELERLSRETQRNEGAIYDMEQQAKLVVQVQALNKINKRTVTAEDLTQVLTESNYGSTPAGFLQELRDNKKRMEEAGKKEFANEVQKRIDEFNSLSLQEQEAMARELQTSDSSTRNVYTLVNKLLENMKQLQKNVKDAIENQGLVQNDQVVLPEGLQDATAELANRFRETKAKVTGEIASHMSQITDQDLAKFFNAVDDMVADQESQLQEQRNVNESVQEQTKENQYSSAFDFEAESASRTALKTAGNQNQGSQTDKEFYDWTSKTNVLDGDYSLRTYNYNQRNELEGLDFQKGYEGAIIAVVIDKDGKVKKGKSGKPLQVKLHDPKLLGAVEGRHIVPAEGKQFAHVSFKHQMAYDLELADKVDQIQRDESLSEEEKDKQINAEVSDFLKSEQQRLQNIIDKANEGSVELVITGQSNGIPSKKDLNGGFRFNDLNTASSAFGKGADVQIIVPSGNFHIFPNGESRKVRNGVPYAYDNKSGKIVRVFTPTLAEAPGARKLKGGKKVFTNRPATVLFKLLMFQQLTPKASRKNQKIFYTDSKTGNKYSIPVFNNKEQQRGAITDLIFFGSENDGVAKDRQFYTSKGNVIFGAEGSVPLSDIVSLRKEKVGDKMVERMYVDFSKSPELQTFLESKLLQVNRGRLVMEETADDALKPYIDVEDLWFPLDENGNPQYTSPEMITTPYASYSDKLLGFEGQFKKGGKVERKSFEHNQGIPSVRTDAQSKGAFQHSYLTFEDSGAVSLSDTQITQEENSETSIQEDTDFKLEDTSTSGFDFDQAVESAPNTELSEGEPDYASLFMGVQPTAKTETKTEEKQEEEGTIIEEETKAKEEIETPPANPFLTPKKKTSKPVVEEGEDIGILFDTETPTQSTSKSEVDLTGLFFTPSPKMNIENYDVYSPADMRKDIKWFRETFKGHDLNIVGGLINGKHFGMALDTGNVLIADQSADGTVFHEAFHVARNMYASQEQNEEINQEFKSREGKGETYQGKIKPYSEFTPLEIEEALAEEFRAYALSKQRTTSVTGKILNFFKDLFSFFENLLRGRKATKTFYDAILSGEAVSGERSNADSTAFSEGRTFKPISLVLENRMVDGLVSYITRDMVSNMSPSDILNGRYDFTNKLLGAGKMLADDMFKSGKVSKDALTAFAIDIKNGKYFAQQVSNRLKALGLTGEFESILEEGNTSEEERYKDTTFMREANTIDPRKMMSRVSRLILRSQPVRKNNEIVRDEFGIELVSNYDSNWLQMTNAMVGVEASKEGFKTKLEELYKQTSNGAFGRYMKVIEKMEGSKEGELLLSRIIQDFAKNKTTYQRLIVSEDGENISMVSADTNKKTQEIISGWKLGYRETVGEKPSKELINKITSLYNKRDYIGAFEAMGIEFDNNVAVQQGKYVDRKGRIETFRSLTRKAVDILTQAQSSKIESYDPFTKISYEGKNLNMGTIFRGLAHIESLSTSKPLSNQIDNEDGQTVYSIGLNTYLSRLAHIFNGSQSREEIIGKYPQWANLHRDHFRWVGLIENGQPVDIDIISGIASSDNTRKGKTTRKMAPDELFLSMLASVQEGVMPIMTTADRGVKHGFNIGKQNVLSLSNRKADIVKAFQGYVKYDKAMLDKANKADIQFNKFQHKRIFDKWTVANTESKLDALLEKEVSKLYDKLVSDKVVPGKAQLEKLDINKTKIPNALMENYMVGEKHVNLKALLADYIVNTQMANIEQMIFFGDVRSFKDPTDTFKRLSMFNSTKKVSRKDSAWMDEHFPRKDGKKGEDRNKIKTVIYKDVVRTSDNVDFYKQTFIDNFLADGMSQKEAKKLADLYSSVYENYDEADAAGWVTLDEYRDILLRSGDWTLSQDKVFEKIQNGETLTADEYVAFPPLKTQYVGPTSEAVEAGLNVNSGYKHSLSPLMPATIRGTALEGLNDFLIENQIGLAQVESGIKFGAIKNESGKINTMELAGGKINTSVNTQSIYYGFFGIQQDMAPKAKDKTTVSTQAQKMIVSDAYNVGEIVVPEGMEADAKALQESIDRFEKHTKGIVNRKRLLLLNTLFPMLNQGEEINDTYLNNVINRLLDLAKDRDVSNNVTKDIYNLRRHKSFEMLINSSEVESIIHSFMNNNVISRKTSGAQMVQVPSTGYVRNDIKGDKGLKFYRKGKDGKTLPMQIKVTLPKEYMAYVEASGGLAKFNQNIPDAVRFGSALRIPVQAMNSLDAYEVVEFLPPEHGDMVVVPSEVVAKSGSDFDIDKLIVYRANIRINKNGISERREANPKEAYEDYFRETLKLDTTIQTQYAQVRQLKEQLSKLNESTLMQLMSNETNASKFAIFGQALNDLRIDGQISADTMNALAVEVMVAQNLLKDQLIKERKLLDEETFAKIPAEVQQPSEYLENVINQEMHNILTNPINRRLLLSPIDDTYLKVNVREMSRKVVASHKIKPFSMDVNIESSLDIFSPVTNMSKHNDYLAGKDAVAVVANNSATRPLIQRTNMTVESIEEKPWVFPHNKDASGKLTLSGRTDTNGFRISESMSAIMNGAVDVAKDPYIFEMNAGMNNLNNVIALTHAGASQEWIFKFMNNPIIKDYIHLKSMMRSTFNVGEQRVDHDKIQQILSDKYKFGSVSKKVKTQEITDAIIMEESPLAYGTMLNAMYQIEEFADRINQFIMATKQDTKGVDKSKDALDIRIKNSKNVSEIGLNNTDKVISDTILDAYDKSRTDFHNRTARFYPFKSQLEYRVFKDQISGIRGMAMATKERLMRAIQNEMTAFALQKNRNSPKVKDLFLGDKSLAKRITELQRRAKKGEIQIPSVMLEFTPHVDYTTNVQGLQIFSKRMDASTIDRYVAELKEYNEMLSTELGMKDFGMDFISALAIMDMVQTGGNYSPLSFRSIVPVEYYGPMIDEYVNGGVVSFQEFMNEFVRQEANMEFLPRLKAKPQAGVSMEATGLKLVMGAAIYFNTETKEKELYVAESYPAEDEIIYKKSEFTGVKKMIRSYNNSYAINSKTTTEVVQEDNTPSIESKDLTMSFNSQEEYDFASYFMSKLREQQGIADNSNNDNIGTKKKSVSQKATEDRTKECK